MPTDYIDFYSIREKGLIFFFFFFLGDFPQQFIAILLPFSAILVSYFYRRNVYDLHHATLGIFSVLFGFR